jgi:hypothetical protein
MMSFNKNTQFNRGPKPKKRVLIGVDATEFESRAALKAASNGSAFNAKRWFCGDDELIHSNGKTYAFSNRWGGPNWHRVWTSKSTFRLRRRDKLKAIPRYLLLASIQPPFP